MTDPAGTISADAEIVLHGRIMPASNATFIGEIEGIRVVYKPIAGERPLWDFPDGTLAFREVAAYAVSAALGWDIVPLTFLREGPHGLGMVQEWREPDEDQLAVDIVAEGQVPRGWLHVFDGLDAADRPVSLIHEDSPSLRAMALFDAVVNNADRKGGHVLAMAGGHRHGVDHGLTFHPDPKLRTVLWGWLDEPLDDAEVEALDRLRAQLDDGLGELLSELIAPDERQALDRRITRLLATRTMPAPRGGGPAIPWPPF